MRLEVWSARSGKRRHTEDYCSECSSHQEAHTILDNPKRRRVHSLATILTRDTQHPPGTGAATHRPQLHPMHVKPRQDKCISQPRWGKEIPQQVKTMPSALFSPAPVPQASPKGSFSECSSYGEAKTILDNPKRRPVHSLAATLKREHRKALGEVQPGTKTSCTQCM